MTALEEYESGRPDYSNGIPLVVKLADAAIAELEDRAAYLHGHNVSLMAEVEDYKREADELEQEAQKWSDECNRRFDHEKELEVEVERLKEGYEKLPSMIESIMVSCNGFQPEFEDGTSVTYRVLVAVKTHAADLVRRWRDEWYNKTDKEEAVE